MQRILGDHTGVKIEQGFYVDKLIGEPYHIKKDNKGKLKVCKAQDKKYVSLTHDIASQLIRLSKPRELTDFINSIQEFQKPIPLHPLQEYFQNPHLQV
ncbi:MAG: hypothetical protein ABIG37_01405 [Nanoarchaeota archaeon]|nr:hypothetical protein [Nanoarchaeota archaeon]